MCDRRKNITAVEFSFNGVLKLLSILTKITKLLSSLEVLMMPKIE